MKHEDSPTVSEPEIVERATAIFSALADPTRFRILEMLGAGEMCVQDLSDGVSVSASAVSHQLRLLKDRELVLSRRDGQRILYSLADDHVAALLDQGRAHASHVDAAFGEGGER